MSDELRPALSWKDALLKINEQQAQIKDYEEALNLIEAVGNDSEKMQGIASAALAKHSKETKE